MLVPRSRRRIFRTCNTKHLPCLDYQFEAASSRSPDKMLSFHAVIVLCGLTLLSPYFASPVLSHTIKKRAVTPPTRSLEDVFTVKTHGDGDCTARLPELRTWLTESADLVATALNAIDDYNTNLNVRKSMATYLGTRYAATGTGPQNQGQVNAVKTYLTRVLNFLNTGALGGGNSPAKLFCDSSWLHFQDPATDWAYTPDSGYVKYDFDQDGQLEPATINEVPALASELTTETQVDGTVITRFPYWAPDILEYVYEQDWGASINHDYCSVLNEDGDLAHNAGTDTNTLPNTMLMCPVAFTRGSATLGSVAAVAGTTPLGTVQSRSLTLFHELFHLTIGNKNTFDWCNSVAECMGASASVAAEQTKARRSPECFAYFALDMWYLRNRQISFADGTAATPA
ncbi:hypothetical protein K461DRAFT_319650 [Myriangium duriaei CBS 260.36]|uniref:Lysine-specific metallo-endopeptidase domain-containing protein n=1 Tax=Myriangium duriaei CBS 260.36 TaxID=1168546 RepID=A0A9P4J5J3_9PEZI|nr:hypothetical protein K461DRAFT_319650 [Myriangium duriaei CBS 260.36]